MLCVVVAEAAFFFVFFLYAAVATFAVERFTHPRAQLLNETEEARATKANIHTYTQEIEVNNQRSRSQARLRSSDRGSTTPKSSALERKKNDKATCEYMLIVDSGLGSRAAAELRSHEPCA